MVFSVSVATPDGQKRRSPIASMHLAWIKGVLVKGAFFDIFVPQLSQAIPQFHMERMLFRKLEKAVAVRNCLLETFSGKFRRCWKILHRFSGSTKFYPCQGLGILRQGKRLLENWPRLRERCWIFSSETATAFLSSSEFCELGAQNLYTNTGRRGPPQTPGSLFGVYVFSFSVPSFPLITSILVYTKPVFCLLRHLRFQS